MARSRIRYRLAAVQELEAASDWYRARDPKVADRFLAAVRAKIADILAQPLSRPANEDGVRLALLKSFPYCIVYHMKGKTVEIVAFAHASRDQGYWRDRLDLP